VIVYITQNGNQIFAPTLERDENKTKYNFFGDFEHLKTYPHMYYIKNDEIKLNPNYEKEHNEQKALANLHHIRELRKPLFRAFDTLEMKYMGIQQGFIEDDEFPLIAEITPERWEEIKAWRNRLRDMTKGNLLNFTFPPTPPEVELFL
jgi:hypothetical protein